MLAVGERLYAVEGQPLKAAPDHDIAMEQCDALCWILAPCATEQEYGR